MTLRISVLLLLVLTAWHQADAQQPSRQTFQDQFNGYAEGGDGSPVWKPVKGVWNVVQKAYVQRATDYDCASVIDRYWSGSYEMTAEFEQLSGDPGAGFVFASSSTTSTEFAQMVRFDGQSIFLMGYYQNGEFTGTASVACDTIRAGTRHRLTLTVDRESNSYSVSLDGRILKSDIPMRYRGGYAGLESSGGAVRYTSVSVRPVYDQAPTLSLDWIRHFAVGTEGEVYVPIARTGVIEVRNGDGDRMRTIGIPAREKGILHAPTGIAFLKSSMAVLDQGSGQVHLFDHRGAWQLSGGWKGKDRGQFDDPTAIAANNNQLFIVDRGNQKVSVMDDSLRTVNEFGSDRLRKPSDISIEDSTIYVLNTGLSQVDLYRWNGKKAVWKSFFPYGGGEGRGIAVHNGIVYLSVVNDVRSYDTSGNLLHTFLGRSMNSLVPAGIVFANQQVYIADFAGGRIIQTTEQLLDPAPQCTQVDSTRIRVEWQSTPKATGYVLATIDGSERRILAKDINGRYTASIDNLAPRTDYRLRFFPVLHTIPADKTPSNWYPCVTSAGPGLKEYMRLPMVAFIFTNVHDDEIKAGVPPQPALPDSEVARIERQLRDAARFYWVQSGMNFFIDLMMVRIDKNLTRSQLYGPESWYPPKDSAIAATFKENKLNLKDFSSILYLTCSQSYDPALHHYVLSGKGGAFTNGVGTGKGYGISWWDVTKANHNAGNNWLMVHEFNHQLDDIFMVSGYPEYWFNHISPTIGTAARFGEHFDANAHIIHMVPREEWFNLKFVQFQTVRDRDEDGIPDNAPYLPLDEVRLGSDSLKVDSDGDGVDDMDEVQFSRWLVEGWGETYGPVVFPNLASKDTDHDGIDDAHDPLPCSAIRPVLSAGSLQSIGEIHDPRLSATISASWSSDSLTFSYVLDKPVPVKLMLDCNDDGWFCSRDNIQIVDAPGQGDSVETKVQLFNGSDPSQWPFMDQQIAAAIHPSVRVTHGKSGTTLTITLPHIDSLSLRLYTGKKIGMLTGFLIPMDESGNKRYLDLYEPNRFFTVTLR